MPLEELWRLTRPDSETGMSQTRTGQIHQPWVRTGQSQSRLTGHGQIQQLCRPGWSDWISLPMWPEMFRRFSRISPVNLRVCQFQNKRDSDFEL